MKKFLLSLAFVALSVATMQAEASYTLREGFEGGKLPDGWSQEYVAGQQDWVVESTDLTYPAGAAEGSYRIALRNNTTQTVGYTTKLVSPQMDLTEVIDPIVVFSHAQQQRSGDVDYLKVYYRSAPDRAWVELKTFDKKIAGWVNDTVHLDAKSKTYQIAFESTDNMGRGVVLDDIRVRAMPTCAIPSELAVEALTTSSATLLWTGSLDTDSFEIVVDKTLYEDASEIDWDNVYIHAFVNPEDGFRYATGDVLTRNTHYYVYMRAHCGGEISDWTGMDFRTKNIVDLPYSLDFNSLTVDKSSVLLMPSFYWTSGTSLTDGDGHMLNVPFVNTNEEPGSADAGKHSLDATMCMVFAGNTSVKTMIPAHNYVYSATPEINVDKIQDVSISFTCTASDSVETWNASGLIVGVMTNPSSWETFVPVDTVYVNRKSSFAKYSVALNSYQGTGKYIALASNFDKPNLLFVDNIVIEHKTYAPVPQNVTLSERNSSSVVVNAEGADKYNVWLTKLVLDDKKKVVLNASSFDEADVISKANGVTLPYKVNIPAEYRGEFVQIYVQAVDGDKLSDWALPVRLNVPMMWDGGELVFDFDDNRYANNWMLKDIENFCVAITASNSYYYPKGTYTPYLIVPDLSSEHADYTYSTIVIVSTTSTNQHSGKGAISLRNMYKKWNSGKYYEYPYGQYMSFPEVANPATFALKFYIKNNGAHPSQVIVGMMKDPQDVSTFDTVAIVDGTLDYTPAVVSFKNYKGEGHFPAIMAGRVLTDDSYSGGSTSGSGGAVYSYYFSYSNIDDVTYLNTSSCAPAANLKETVDAESLDLEWIGGEGTWNLNIYSDKTGETLVKSLHPTECKAHVDGLNPHTNYWYTLEAACDAAPENFLHAVRTSCYDEGEPLPYIEDFESYPGGSSTDPNHELPNCWEIPQIAYTSGGGGESSTSYYPFIWNYASYAHSGTKILYYYTGSATSGDLLLSTVLPKMSDDVNKLQLSFWTKSGASSIDTLQVGVLTDPTDWSTFEILDSIVVTGATYVEHIQSFASYTGQGRYIGWRKTKKSTTMMYIDDVKVKYLSNCGVKVTGLASTTTDEGLALSWNKQDGFDQYEILVTKNAIENMDNIPADEVVVRKTVIAANGKDTVRMTEGAFQANTIYSVYVRSYCSASNAGDWSDAAQAKTSCLPVTIEDFGTEDFADVTATVSAKDCWILNSIVTAGTAKGTSQINVNKYLYLYDAKNTATAVHSAYAVLPELNVDDIAKYQITFEAHGGTATEKGVLEIGVAGDAIETYQAVQTLNLPVAPSTVAATDQGFIYAEQLTVRFADYIGDAEGVKYRRPVLMSKGSTEAINRAYIRNIKFTKTGDVLEPIHITIPASSIEVGTAKVHWEKVAGATAYEVKYATAAIDPEVDTVLVAGSKLNVKTINVTDTFAVLTDLPGLTQYYVYVRTVAGAQKSIWSNVRRFRSACPAKFAAPYEEGFDTYLSGSANHPDCWEYASSHATAYPYVNSSSVKDGVNGLYFISSKTDYSYAVLPKLELPLNQLMVSLDWKGSNTSYDLPIKIGFIADGADISTIEKFEAAFVPFYETSSNKKSVWTSTGALALDTLTTDGQIVIYAPKNTSGAGNIHVDNVLVERIPTCFPATMAQTTATTTSITIKITDNFNQTAWDVALVAPGADVEDATPVTVSLADTIKGGLFVISGLPHSSVFDAYVRANCGAGDVSKWSKPVKVATDYLVALDKAQWNFDDPETQQYIPGSTSKKQEIGWTVGNRHDGTYGTNTTYMTEVRQNSATAIYSASGTGSLLVGYGSTTAGTSYSYAILPQVDASFDTLQIALKARACYTTPSKVTGLDSVYYNSYGTGSYKRTLSIGVMTDLHDIKTLTKIQDVILQDVDNNKKLIVDENSYWEDIVLPLFGVKGTNLVLYSDYTNYNYIIVDDVVISKEAGCSSPSGLAIVDSTLTYNAVDVVWVSNKTKWQVQLYAAGNDSVPAMDSIFTVDHMEYQTHFSLKNLEGNTAYTLMVRSVCNEDEYGVWNKTQFTTCCAPMADVKDAAWDFESGLYVYGTSATYQIPDCWETRCATTVRATGVTTLSTSQSYIPYAIPDASNLYARGSDGTEEVKQHALQFNGNYNANTAYDSWVVLPDLGYSLVGMKLHLFARATRATKSTSKMVDNSKYGKKLYLGYMSDIDSLHTFVKLDSIIYTKTTATSMYYYDREDQYWEESFVDLDKFDGKRIVIMLPSPVVGGATGYFYLDDIEIIPADFCFKPSAVRVEEIAATSAKVCWKNEKKTQVQVATSEYFEEGSIVFDGLTPDETAGLVVTGLKNGTTYYTRVRHICDGESVSEWVVASAPFTTIYKPRFFQDFKKVGAQPADWTRYYNRKMLLAAENKVPFGTSSPTKLTDASGWHRVSTSAGMAAGHMIINNYTTLTSLSSWLISPQIDLREYGEQDNVMLAFDLALTDGVNHKGGPANIGDCADDVFAVAVSTKNMQYWSVDDITVWGSQPFAADTTKNADGGVDTTYIQPTYAYTAIPSTYGGKTYMVNLNKYKGQIINIAFYAETTVKNDNNDIHLSGVHVNAYSATENELTLCRWEDYADDVFSIDAEELTLGENVFEKYMKSSVSGGDRLTRVRLSVTPDEKTEMTMTLCEGETFKEYNYDFVADKNGVRKQKLQSVNGCDSTVVLDLTVTPKIYTDTLATICHGKHFDFGGEQYYTSGNYPFTTTSAVTGCDSIITLHLTVTAAVEGAEEVYLCPGTTYQLGDTVIATAGTYERTIVTDYGCDSIASVVVTEVPNESTTIRAIICKGSTYSEDPFRGLTLPGSYPITLPSQFGCDSTVTLQLMVADEQMKLTDSISIDMLPYVVNGQEILPVTTTEGIYTQKIILDCGACELTVIVGEPQGINNLASDSKRRKILVNDQVYIICDGQWYNAIGQRVEPQR